MMVDEVVTFHDAHTYLGTELHVCGSLTTDDGTQIKLDNTNYTVFAAMLRSSYLWHPRKYAYAARQRGKGRKVAGQWTPPDHRYTACMDSPVSSQ